jgi:DNA-binding transcriptional LysR family regulator
MEASVPAEVVPLHLAASRDVGAVPLPEPPSADLDLRAVRWFLVLVEEGKFRRAARRLNVSQPGLSRVISSLERRVGVALIDRDTRPFSLTREGEIMAIYGRLIQQLERAALREMARASATGQRAAAGGWEWDG